MIPRLFLAVFSLCVLHTSSQSQPFLPQSALPPPSSSYYDQTFYIVQDTDDRVTEVLTYSDLQSFQALERGTSDPNPASFLLQDRDDGQQLETFTFADVQEYDSERQISLA